MFGSDLPYRATKRCGARNQKQRRWTTKPAYKAFSQVQHNQSLQPSDSFCDSSPVLRQLRFLEICLYLFGINLSKATDVCLVHIVRYLSIKSRASICTSLNSLQSYSTTLPKVTFRAATNPGSRPRCIIRAFHGLTM